MELRSVPSLDKLFLEHFEEKLLATIKIKITIREKKNVETAPPIYPSHVFFGDKDISLFFP